MDKTDFLETIPEIKRWIVSRPLWQRLMIVVLGVIWSASAFESKIETSRSILLNRVEIALSLWCWILIGAIIFGGLSIFAFSRLRRKKRVYTAFCSAWQLYAKNLEMIQMYWYAYAESPNISAEKKQEYERLSTDHVVHGHALREKAKYLLSRVTRLNGDFKYHDNIWLEYAKARPKLRPVYPTPFHFLTDSVNPMPMLTHTYDEWREADYLCSQYIVEIENRIFSQSRRFKEIDRRNDNLRNQSKRFFCSSNPANWSTEIPV